MMLWLKRHEFEAFELDRISSKAEVSIYKYGYLSAALCARRLVDVMHNSIAVVKRVYSRVDLRSLRGERARYGKGERFDRERSSRWSPEVERCRSLRDSSSCRPRLRSRRRSRAPSSESSRCLDFLCRRSSSESLSRLFRSSFLRESRS
jgi:hypothetical protein